MFPIAHNVSRMHIRTFAWWCYSVCDGSFVGLRHRKAFQVDSQEIGTRRPDSLCNSFGIYLPFYFARYCACNCVFALFALSASQSFVIVIFLININPEKSTFHIHEQSIIIRSGRHVAFTFFSCLTSTMGRIPESVDNESMLYAMHHTMQVIEGEHVEKFYPLIERAFKRDNVEPYEYTTAPRDTYMVEHTDTSRHFKEEKTDDVMKFPRTDANGVISFGKGDYQEFTIVDSTSPLLVIYLIQASPYMWKCHKVDGYLWISAHGPLDRIAHTSYIYNSTKGTDPKRPSSIAVIYEGAFLGSYYEAKRRLDKSFIRSRGYLFSQSMLSIFGYTSIMDVVFLVLGFSFVLLLFVSKTFHTSNI